MHADIEHYYKNEPYENNSKEFEQFLEFAGQHYLRPYRSEWRVYNEDKKIVGTIDMVFEHRDGTVSIYDWKRSKKLDKYEGWGKKAKHGALKHIADTNFWHYTLQLNAYKMILERKYGFVVKDMFLICIHPDLDTTYQKHEVAPMDMDPLIKYDQKSATCKINV
jgi:ATP-dependent exoDNAse (exonuclease V) beta subunit